MMKLNGTATFMHILFYPWCIFLKNVLWRGNKRKGKNTALFFPGFRVVQWASLQYFHADALHVSTLFVIIAVIVLLSLSVISVPCWFESEISLDHYRGLALRGGGGHVECRRGAIKNNYGHATNQRNTKGPLKASSVLSSAPPSLS